MLANLLLLCYVLKLRQIRNGQASTEDTGTLPTYSINEEVSAGHDR